MENEKVKILIIDESKDRIDEIKSFLPDYFEIKANSFGVGIKEVIKTFQPHVIIMFADDRRGQGLYLFSWIKSDDNYGEIPILLLSENAMSERILQYLEIGEAQVYYPTQGQGQLFLIITEMLEEFEEAYYDRLIEEDIKRIEGSLNSDYTEKKKWTRAELEEIARQPAWHAESMQMLKVILEARKKLESDPYVLGMQKACAFSAINHTVHVHGRPEKLLTIDNEYRKKQLQKSLARGERQMMNLKTALHQMLEKKIRMSMEQPALVKEPTIVKEPILTKKMTAAKDPSVIKMNPVTEPVKMQPAFAQPEPQQIHRQQDLWFEAERKREEERMQTLIREANMKAQASTVPKRKKILVVDDDIATLKTIKNFLQEEYDVVLVNSGAQAIDYIIRYKADLLIIDYRMPMLDGATTLKSIRYQPNGMNTPAFFLTALADQDTIDKCISAGARGVITKPISQKKILSIVASFFQK